MKDFLENYDVFVSSLLLLSLCHYCHPCNLFVLSDCTVCNCASVMECVSVATVLGE